MQRMMHHRLTLTSDEVRDAILAWLRANDQPQPSEGSDVAVDTAKVVIAWTETTDTVSAGLDRALSEELANRPASLIK